MTQFMLRDPIIITPRLMAGVVVGGGYVSIEYGGGRNGRQVYKYAIDLPDGSEHEGNDLCSGMGGGSLQSGLESLLAFLGACAEGVNYSQRTGRTSENSDLFPANVAEWAAAHEDEISMLACELEENDSLIVET